MTVPPFLKCTSRTFTVSQLYCFSYMLFVSDIMPSSRRSALQLSRVVRASGSLADVSCNHCRSVNRPCIVSSMSRRCVECLSINRGCSRSHSRAGSNSLLLREIELREELDYLPRRLSQCLALIDSLSQGSPLDAVDR